MLAYSLLNSTTRPSSPSSANLTCGYSFRMIVTIPTYGTMLKNGKRLGCVPGVSSYTRLNVPFDTADYIFFSDPQLAFVV